MSLSEKDTLQLQLDKGFKDCIEDLRIRFGKDFNVGAFSNQQTIKRLLWHSLKSHGYDFTWGEEDFTFDNTKYRKIITENIIE